MSIIDRISSSKPILLDGALGTLLSQESQSHALWSTHAVVVEPRTIESIHEEYIQNGAELLLTSTYQTSEANVKKWFKDEDYSEVVKRSVDLAYEAKMKCNGGRQVFIAGSVGPFGASLANGAEYTGDYGNITDEELVEFHRKRLDILCDDRRVDIIAWETVPSLQEVRVLTRMMNEREKPYYLSFSVKEDTLADGTPLDEFVTESLKGKNLTCIGVNCLGSSSSLHWLSKLRPFGKPLVVYPNSGEIYRNGKWEDAAKVDAMSWVDYVEQLHAIGNVKIIGGCCRTTPETIKAIGEAINKVW
ncbi:mmuM [Cyberlindnera jadinii]|uniref:MmuM protein n=1 Tax=Cyberlindnera jadinii (strain ATCC 18201 / CBS 1600 / BCRC 20928 / JCM 3617 / NBRC 0987 / NRRL Y-1542) TaxID=983966 RepID=A0A0H5CAY0_CYBJN|nr:mmuM [Cyberlindnera jadinii]